MSNWKNELPDNRTENSEIRSNVKLTLDLLEKGEAIIEQNAHCRRCILVLGDTGCGKSTLVQFIAGNSEELTVKEISGHYLIRDTHDRIGTSNFDSHTLFPEFITVSNHDTTVVDNGGWSDSRSPNHEIAITYFIKKILDNAENVKIVIMTNHHAVQLGVERLEFKKLLRNATNLIKNVHKYRDSIALVVTKVENVAVSQNGVYLLKTDSAVLEEIIGFLQAAKKDLQRQLELSVSEEDRNFHNNCLVFVDSFINDRSKIGIFRKPSGAGRICNDELMREKKPMLENLVYNRINFGERADGDFGYTVSEPSLNFIKDITEEINETVWRHISTIVEKIQSYYQNLVHETLNKINNFETEKSLERMNVEDAEYFATMFSDGLEASSNIISYLRKNSITDPKKLAQVLSSQLNVNQLIKLDVSDKIYEVGKLGNYLNFLHSFITKRPYTRSWLAMWENIPSILRENRAKIQDPIMKISNIIIDQLTNIFETMRHDYTVLMEPLDIHNLKIMLTEECNKMNQIVETVEKSSLGNEFREYFPQILTLTGELNLRLSENDVLFILNRKICLKFLKIISGENLRNVSLERLCPFNSLAAFLEETKIWFDFLNNLYLKFSSYPIQYNKKCYNVKNLSDWGNALTTEIGIFIDLQNIRMFLNMLAPQKIVGYDKVQNYNLTNYHLENLNHVLDLTLKQSFTTHIESDGYLIIKGEFINTKAILGIIQNYARNCSTENRATKINIFALNTVFFDSDLSLSGREVFVSIIAPKWQVIGSRKIELNGADGESGNLPLEPGRDGEPGHPGSNGGIFFGVCEECLNGSQLTIIANGGNGGSGQNGADGQTGVDGQTPTVPTPEELSPDDAKVTSVNGLLCVDASKYGADMYDTDLLVAKALASPFKAVENVARLAGNIAIEPTNIKQHAYNFKQSFYFWIYYRIHGTHGRPGGNGGHGGEGGYGGHPGRIILHDFDSSSGIQSICREGNVGQDGHGGQAGRAGRNGDDILICYDHQHSRWFHVETFRSYSVGSTGRDGERRGNRTENQPDSIVEFWDSTDVLNMYQSYLKANTSDIFRKSALLEFEGKLNQLRT